MGLFYLLTIYCVLRGAGSPRGFWWYLIAVICCALGMGSKAVMVTAPVVVFLFDRTFISKSFIQTLRRRWLLHVGLLATWSVLWVTDVAKGVLNPSTTRAVVRPATVGFGMTDVTPWEYLTTQADVLVHYLRLSLWPHPLCLDYGWPMAKSTAEAVVPGIAILALLAGTLWALWRKPWLGFLGAWFFIILAPTSSFVPLKDPIFEHRMYLSTAAVVALVVIIVHAVLRTVFARSASGAAIRPTIGAILAGVAVLALGAVTRERHTDYHSQVTMWEDVVAKRPENARGHHNLGSALDNEGRYDEAVRAFREAARLDPLDETTYTSLGQSLARQGKLSEALAALRRALEIGPQYAKAHRMLGTVFAMMGETDQAIDALRQAAELDPRDPRTHYNLANALSEKGLAEEAIEHYEAALRLRPQFPDALVNLGIELQGKGLYDEAAAKLEEALRLDPAHKLARVYLGYDLIRRGRVETAVNMFREGVRLRPDDADSHFHLGQALVQANQPESALREFDRTLRLRPDHPQARRARDALLGGGGG
jgi:tetratricopeptide (TPR) repeat protein